MQLATTSSLRRLEERAEHVMLIDLWRNDLGRVAECGSVRVTEQMVIERYSHVTHIVSHVAARWRTAAAVRRLARDLSRMARSQCAQDPRDADHCRKWRKADAVFYSGIVG